VTDPADADPAADADPRQRTEPADPERADVERAAAAGIMGRAPLRAGLSWGLPLGALVVLECWDASRLGWPSRWWAVVATLAVAAAAAGSLPTVRARFEHPGLVPGLLGGCLLAIYAAVPETDQIPRVAVAVAAVFAVELVRRRPAPLPWHVAAVALVLWAGVFGATGRQSALLAALFAMSPLVLVAVYLGRPSNHPALALVAAGIGVAAAVGVSRTGGIEPTAGPAVLAVAVGVVVEVVSLRALRSTGTPRPRPGAASDPTAHG
jgi:hypothetical protein